MSQLRSDIIYKRKRNEIEASEKQYKRIHIATPIQQYDETESNDEIEEYEELPTEFSEDEIMKPLSSSDTIIIEDTNTIQDIEVSDQDHWERIMEDWFEMLETENYVPESENENFEFEFGGRSIHSADDSLAKWKLLDMFNDSLEAPVFIV